MTRKHFLAPLGLLVLLAAPAWAQFEGLDLSDSAPKKDDKKKDEKKPDEGGLDLSGPSTPEPTKPAETTAPKKDERKPLAKKDAGPAVERDITQEDRVKSVQRKLYMKRGRFELAPSINFNVNDPYYTRFGGQLRAAFYPADNLAFAVRGSMMQTLPSDDVRVAKKALQSRIFYSVPQWNVMADLEWSPLYGKVSFLNSILHFDGYLIGGAGVVYTETSASKQMWPAFDLGLGMRFVAKDFLAVNVGLVNTTYSDVPTGTTKASTQNMLMLNAGVSIFFPFKSTFREAE